MTSLLYPLLEFPFEKDVLETNEKKPRNIQKQVKLIV